MKVCEGFHTVQMSRTLNTLLGVTPHPLHINKI